MDTTIRPTTPGSAASRGEASNPPSSSVSSVEGQPVVGTDEVLKGGSRTSRKPIALVVKWPEENDPAQPESFHMNQALIDARGILNANRIESAVISQAFVPALSEVLTRLMLATLGKGDQVGAGEFIKGLVFLGADPQTRDSNGCPTPVFIAAKSDGAELLEALIECGASPDVRDFDRRTPLMTAIQERKSNAARFLANASIDLDARDPDGDSALHYAALKDNLEAARILVDRGADPTLYNRKQQVPWQTAAEKGYRRMTSLLLAAVDRWEAGKASEPRKPSVAQ